MSKEQFVINKTYFFFLLALSFFLFCGCEGIRGKLLVMKANMQTSQMQQSPQQSNEAIAAYSEALHYAEAAPYAEYGLGLVYLFLGEDASALSRFDNAAAMIDAELPSARDAELNYRIHYNRGILHFQASRFEEAASEFKHALEIDESQIEAKRNLELSLLSLEQENAVMNSSSQGKINSDESKENTLFDYLRQKEVDSWKEAESTEEHNSPWLDY
jgi:Ca-activated chloride channel family protein